MYVYRYIHTYRYTRFIRVWERLNVSPRHDGHGFTRQRSLSATRDDLEGLWAISMAKFARVWCFVHHPPMSQQCIVKGYEGYLKEIVLEGRWETPESGIVSGDHSMVVNTN